MNIMRIANYGTLPAKVGFGFTQRQSMKSRQEASIDPVEVYFEQIGAIPSLDVEEEAELAWRAKRGDIHAKDTLIGSQLKLVVAIAKAFQGRLDFQDLIAEGNKGLMKAVETFNPSRGRLSTHAFRPIRQTIKRAI